jgi:uncharacterized protein (DUF2141 family)
MKLTYATLFCLLLSSLWASGQTTIEVTITKIKPGKGNIRVGLFNEANFLGKPVEGKEVKANSESVVIKFENVADGEYALSVIHDANENGTLDKSKLGIPKEGFAFSNDVMGKKGPPSFEKASFEVKGTTVVKQVLTMRYP